MVIGVLPVQKVKHGQISRWHKARVANALYYAAWHSKTMLQQEEAKVLKMDKLCKNLADEVAILTRRVEQLQANRLFLMEALKEEEQNLAVEMWLRDEELKLLRILLQRWALNQIYT